jgi:hypothetical protein
MVEISPPSQGLPKSVFWEGTISILLRNKSGELLFAAQADESS